MRICYLADGRYIHTHRWLRSFKKRGHEVSLISFQPMDEGHVAAVEREGSAYLGSLGPFHVKRFWRTWQQLRWLVRTLRRERIDIVHCHFISANTWYAALSGFRPLVLTVMGGDVCGPSWSPRENIAARVMTPFALKRADLVTTWSSLLAHTVRPYVGQRTALEVVHGGIDLDQFGPAAKSEPLRRELRLPPDAKVVFSPRLMRPPYNLHRIAEAAGIVMESDPRVFFVFGYSAVPRDEVYETRVKQIATSTGFADRFRFIERIPHEAMADYFRLADVTVSIPDFDGTPMSVLESMACGTPTVIGAIPDYDSTYFESGKTVTMAQVDDLGSIAAAITTMLNDHDAAHRLACEARRRVVESGGFDSQMLKMEHLYHSLSRRISEPR